ncbi:hypothetical protein N2152v2_003678 [Parachlorella kessleri]
MGKSLLVAIDESVASKNAAKWCCNNLVKPEDTLHLVAVTAPPTYSVAPAAPIATAGAVAALSLNWEAQRKAEEERGREVLKEVMHELAADYGVDRKQIDAHLLAAAGGASGAALRVPPQPFYLIVLTGVAESLVAFAKERKVDLLVLGSRGMGSVKSTLMSVVGLGSVSDYCLHNLSVPVVVVRGREADTRVKPSRKVMVALDESDLSKAAELWTIKNVFRPEDELHLVSVALPVPYQIAEEDSIAAHVLETDEVAAAREDSLGFADEVAHAGVEAALAQGEDPLNAAGLMGPPMAVRSQEDDGGLQPGDAEWRQGVAVVLAAAGAAEGVGVDKKRIFFKAMRPEGGASDVGESVVHYALENGVDVVVVGSRGMGSLKRALMSFVGLGSVSDYVVHHLEHPVIVYKG